MWPGPLGEFSGKKTLTAALDMSLQRMHLDYVDIFYAHRWDPNTNLRETAEALDLIVRQGKALYVGVSNYTTEQVAEIGQIFDELHTPFIGNQMSYNMFNREAETTDMLAELDKHHAGLIAYGPLAEGLLTDRYLDGFPADMPLHRTNAFIKEDPEGTVAKLNALNAVAAGSCSKDTWSVRPLMTGIQPASREGTTVAGRYLSEEHLEQIRKLNEIAKNRGQTLAQLAMAWLLRDKRVPSIVIGASSVDHLLDNVKVADNMTLSAEELAKIDAILNNK